MKPTSIIFKSTSFLILAVIFHMHFCSVMCATGVRICCGKEEDASAKKECCSKKKTSDKKDNDCGDGGCQDMHSAFFGATGQSVLQKSDISINPFYSLVAVFVPVFALQHIEAHKDFFDYNIFHPPPLKTDIRVLIQSFLI